MRKMLRDGTFESLPPEEALTFADAYLEDAGAEMLAAQEEMAGAAALVFLARHCLPGDDPLRAIAAVRRKRKKTPDEVEALAAWDRIKGRDFSK